MLGRLVLGGCLLTLMLFFKGATGQTKQFVAGHLPYGKGTILPGDLLFRHGTGFFSQYFMKAGSKPSPYSHIGLIANHDGQLVVLHAEASEFTGIGGVKVEPLEIFLSLENARKAAVYRVTATHKQRQKAVNYAFGAYIRKVPFDTAFDAFDQSRLYCTELVWQAYRSAGLDLAPVMDQIIVGSDAKQIISLNNILESTSVYGVQTITRR